MRLGVRSYGEITEIEWVMVRLLKYSELKFYLEIEKQKKYLHLILQFKIQENPSPTGHTTA